MQNQSLNAGKRTSVEGALFKVGMIVSKSGAGRLEVIFNEDPILSLRQFPNAKSTLKCWRGPVQIACSGVKLNDVQPSSSPQ